MTARFFGFDAALTVLFAVVDHGVRTLAPGKRLARVPAGRIIGTPRRAAKDRQLPYLDDRMLNDIGLRRDQFPSVARERLQDRVMRFHV